MSRIKDLLITLNPDFVFLEQYINQRIEELSKRQTLKSEDFSEKSTVLITYPDQFSGREKSNLAYLSEFMENELEGCCSHVHILPFYPWTSDDGFSAINYHEVASEYGAWSDIESLNANLMFDCIFNHLSQQNPFFQKALSGEPECEEMFHVYNESTFQTKEFQEAITKVVRPRVSALFTPFIFGTEKKFAWTTFSEDQVDTNLKNPQMMQYVLECFFLYIEKGATFFRIDAVPFLWKELGTNCSHLPHTHNFVKLLRAIVDSIGSGLKIITESNVPHQENITYWGNGEDEAHIIYNFSLAPLLLHAMTFETNAYFNKWATNVFDIHPNNHFFNFTATHDGIGVRGLEGLVPEEDVKTMGKITVEKGGVVGLKRSRNGEIRPYELNITWASYLNDNKLENDVYLKKIVHSHALAMFFPGIGAHYVHNFFGTQNWQDGHAQSGIARRLNRKKFEYPLMKDPFAEACRKGLIELIRFKNNHKAFHPKGEFKIIDKHPQLLIFDRSYEESTIRVIFNLTAKEVVFDDQVIGPYDLSFQ